MFRAVLRSITLTSVLAVSVGAFAKVPVVKPKLTLTKATTLDAKSVTLYYSVAQAAITKPLRLDFYRSSTAAKSVDAVKLGTLVLSPTLNKGDLSLGLHHVSFVTPGLKPDAHHRFITVVANSDASVIEDPTSVNTIYFRKWMLGVLTHGLSTDDPATTAYVTAFSKDLVTYTHYDRAVPFYWLAQSRLQSSGQTQLAGTALNTFIKTQADALAKHAGDVVDLHLFAHSRGTVVTSQALTKFVARTDPALLGSYVEVTLLDIHPANKTSNTLLSYVGTFQGAYALSLVQGFQNSTFDPEVTLPAHANIFSVDIWGEHSLATAFPSGSNEGTLNLWGQMSTSNHVVNSSGVVIVWHSLTGVKDASLGVIGHAEVPSYYDLRVVRPGLVF